MRSSAGISKKKLAKLAKRADVDIWALDEVHFQQYGSRCRMWVPPEVKEPTMLHHPTRKSIGYFGAVRCRDGKFACQVEDDRFNAQSFWDFMMALKSKATRSGKKVVVLVDNAKYHHANLHKVWRLEQTGVFELLFLPAYSPDFNPVERVWKLTRRLCIHNRYFGTLREVSDVVGAKFREWASPNDTLRRLCAII